MRKFFLCTVAALVVALGAVGCSGSGSSSNSKSRTEEEEWDDEDDTEKKESQKKETTEDDDEVSRPTKSLLDDPVTTVPETTEEETTAEETTPEETTAARVSNTVFQTGTWDGLVFTNPWLNLQIAFPEGTHIASEEEIEASVGAGADVIVNNGLYTQEQLDASSVLSVYDFMVTLPDQVSNVQLMYENTVLAGEADITAADYISIIGQQLQQIEGMGYEIIGTGQANIAGEEYEYLDLQVLDGAMGQSYFCRKKDSYMVSLIVTYVESSAQDVVDILTGAVAVN